MKKILSAAFVAMLGMATVSSCSDVPAPYDILPEEGGNGNGDAQQPAGNPFGLDASNPVSDFVANFEEQPDFVQDGTFNSNLNYDYQLEGWKNVAEVGDRIWTGVVFKDGDKYLRASANKGKEPQYTSWFISPAFKVDQIKDKTVSFDCAGAFFYQTTTLKVYFLELINGVMNKTEVAVQGIPTSGSNYAWVRGINADLSAFAGKVGFIGFEYVGEGGASKSTTYTLDNIKCGKAEAQPEKPQPEKPSGDDPYGLDASKPVASFAATFDDIVDKQDYSLQGWTNVNVAGNKNVWQGAAFNADKYIRANTYNMAADQKMEAWFITPAFTVNDTDKFTFDCAGANWKETTTLKVFFMEKPADGKVVKTELTVQGIPTSGNNYAWAKDIQVDLTAYKGKVGFVGFEFVSVSTGNNKGMATYQIDNVRYGKADQGGDQGGQTEPQKPADEKYQSNIELTPNTADKAYDGKVSVDGVEYPVLKLGTTKAAGTWTSAALTANAAKMSFYVVGWTGKTGNLTVTIENGGSFKDGQTTKTIDLDGKTAGAAGNSPFTITPAASDFKEFELTGITATSTVKFTTADSTADKRAIIFGLKIK